MTMNSDKFMTAVAYMAVAVSFRVIISFRLISSLSLSRWWTLGSTVAHRRAERCITSTSVAATQQQQHTAGRRRYRQNARNVANNEIKRQRQTSNLLPSRQTHPGGPFLTHCYKLCYSPVRSGTWLLCSYVWLCVCAIAEVLLLQTHQTT